MKYVQKIQALQISGNLDRGDGANLLMFESATHVKWFKVVCKNPENIRWAQAACILKLMKSRRPIHPELRFLPLPQPRYRMVQQDCFEAQSLTKLGYRH